MCLHFRSCICTIVCLSSMASLVVQGSDSHNAPLLFVLLCEKQCAALSASFVPLGSLPQRQGLALFPLLFRPLSVFLSLFNTHWVLLSISLTPVVGAYCLSSFVLIHNETLLHLLILPLRKNVNINDFCVCVYDLYPLPSFFGHPSSVYSLLPLTCKLTSCCVFFPFKLCLGEYVLSPVLCSSPLLQFLSPSLS